MMRRAFVLLVALAAVACNKTADAPAGDSANKTTEAKKAPASAAAATEAPKASPTAAFPAGEAGAKQLLGSFLKPGTDIAALSMALKPKKGDYAAAFVGEAAAKAEAGYAPAWQAGAIRIQPKAGQTELLLFSATGAELAAGGAKAQKFPGGYAKIAAQLNPEVTFYRFKFVKPGATLGMAFDGLAHVNGHWAIFPKPWRALK